MIKPFIELRQTLSGFCAKRLQDPVEFWHSLLFITFWLSLALFPIGYGWREVTPPLCLIFLLIYYRHAWQESVLRRLKVVWLFACVALMSLIGIVFSINPWQSFLHVGMGINKAFILPFIAMECVRTPQNLRQLVWAFVFACFWQGLDGVWQAWSGFDFIMGYAPNSGRLTGSLGDYTVGNYLALALVPAFGVWFILKGQSGSLAALLIFTALFWPAFFLFQGASSRSGALAIAGALALWALINYSWKNWRVYIYPMLVMAGFIICQPARLLPSQVLADDRWDLWHLGWQVFMARPLTGAGAGQYNNAFRSLGLAPQHEAITISHPHNLYLDMLYAHGIVGFIAGMIFVAGFALWGYRRIRKNLLAERRTSNIYWRLTAWFWLGYMAWLINGIFGHDFYRIWWLALAMCSLGIMTGAIINAPQSCDKNLLEKA